MKRPKSRYVRFDSGEVLRVYDLGSARNAIRKSKAARKADALVKVYMAPADRDRLAKLAGDLDLSRSELAGTLLRAFLSMKPEAQARVIMRARERGVIE